MIIVKRELAGGGFSSYGKVEEALLAHTAHYCHMAIPAALELQTSPHALPVQVTNLGGER